QAIRRPELHTHVQVSGAARVQPRQPATAQVEHVATLRAAGHTQIRARHDRRYGDLRTEPQLRIRDEHFGIEIFTITLEARIFRHLEDHVHVATFAAALASVAYPAKRHVLPRGNAGRDLDRELALLTHASIATTL